MKRKPIVIVTGGQYGSESKGAIAAHLVVKRNIDYAVRTGATNAGHSVEFRGVTHAMQQLPVGWVNQDTKLVLGAGALIDPAILDREIRMINSARGDGSDIRHNLYIDPRAYLHLPHHAVRSRESGRHHAIGATGKGCSEALVDRVRLRGVIDMTVGTTITESADSEAAAVFDGCHVCDTEKLLNTAFDDGRSILLEGCQGTLLDLYLGPYPFTTHKQTTPAQWMSECGLSPALPTEIVMAVRTYPIRVAGNSGPLDGEISWPVLARRINHRLAIAGQPPLVDETAIVEFEHAVQYAARQFKIPYGSDGLNMHAWTPVERGQYQEALSEVHKVALQALDVHTVAALRRLFEMTTVTKKLRRIAELSHHDLRVAARQVRPAAIAVTFMNYMFPDMAGSAESLTSRESAWLHDNVVSITGCPVRWINRGPAADHVIECRVTV